jgi:hypothetical protein
LPITQNRHLAQDARNRKDYDDKEGNYHETIFHPYNCFYSWLNAHFYVVPIILGFGAQAALYSVLRFRLFIPVTSTSHTGTLMGTSGGTSATAMVACCIHHVTDVLPILGLSAVASFLTRYQRPFMLVGLTMNILSIITMLFILYRERQKLQPVLEAK